MEICGKHKTYSVIVDYVHEAVARFPCVWNICWAIPEFRSTLGAVYFTTQYYKWTVRLVYIVSLYNR